MPDRPSTDLSTPGKFDGVAHEPDRLSVDGWQKMRFGELAFHISDRVDDPKTAGVTTYVGLDHLDPGSLKIKRRGTPDDVNATKLRVKPGQIIFGKRRAYQRKVAVADFDGICSAHAMVLEANPKTTAPGFLPFFMQSDIFFDRALAISEGSLSPTIKWKTLATQEFLIPPIARQKELVELFQAIEDAISATEKSISAAEELKRSLMSELLTKGIGHTEFRKTELGEIPTDWNVVPIKDVCEIFSGATPSRSQFGKYYEDATIPWVKTMDLNEDWIEETDEKITEKALTETNCRLLPKSTILLAMYGGWEQIGRTSILGIESATNQAISSLVPSELLNPEYLLYYLQAGRSRWKRIAASSRKDPNITKEDVKTFLITLPNKEHEQKQIVKIISLSNKQIRKLETHINGLKKLKIQIINSLLFDFSNSVFTESF